MGGGGAGAMGVSSGTLSPVTTCASGSGGAASSLDCSVTSASPLDAADPPARVRCVRASGSTAGRGGGSWVGVASGPAFPWREAPPTSHGSGDLGRDTVGCAESVASAVSTCGQKRGGRVCGAVSVGCATPTSVACPSTVTGRPFLRVLVPSFEAFGSSEVVGVGVRGLRVRRGRGVGVRGLPGPARSWGRCSRRSARVGLPKASSSEVLGPSFDVLGSPPTVSVVVGVVRGLQKLGLVWRAGRRGAGRVRRGPSAGGLLRSVGTRGGLCRGGGLRCGGGLLRRGGLGRGGRPDRGRRARMREQAPVRVAAGAGFGAAAGRRGRLRRGGGLGGGGGLGRGGRPPARLGGLGRGGGLRRGCGLGEREQARRRGAGPARLRARPRASSRSPGQGPARLPARPQGRAQRGCRLGHRGRAWARLRARRRGQARARGRLGGGLRGASAADGDASEEATGGVCSPDAACSTGSPGELPA